MSSLWSVFRTSLVLSSLVCASLSFSAYAGVNEAQLAAKVDQLVQKALKDTDPEKLSRHMEKLNEELNEALSETEIPERAGLMGRMRGHVLPLIQKIMKASLEDSEGREIATVMLGNPALDGFHIQYALELIETLPKKKMQYLGLEALAQNYALRQGDPEKNYQKFFDIALKQKKPAKLANLLSLFTVAQPLNEAWVEKIYQMASHPPIDMHQEDFSYWSDENYADRKIIRPWNEVLFLAIAKRLDGQASKAFAPQWSEKLLSLVPSLKDSETKIYLILNLYQKYQDDTEKLEKLFALVKSLPTEIERSRVWRHVMFGSEDRYSIGPVGTFFLFSGSTQIKKTSLDWKKRYLAEVRTWQDEKAKSSMFFRIKDDKNVDDVLLEEIFQEVRTWKKESGRWVLNDLMEIKKGDPNWQARFLDIANAQTDRSEKANMISKYFRQNAMTHQQFQTYFDEVKSWKLESLNDLEQNERSSANTRNLNLMTAKSTIFTTLMASPWASEETAQYIYGELISWSDEDRLSSGLFNLLKNVKNKHAWSLKIIGDLDRLSGERSSLIHEILNDQELDESALNTLFEKTTSQLSPHLAQVGVNTDIGGLKLRDVAKNFKQMLSHPSAPQDLHEKIRKEISRWDFEAEKKEWRSARDCTKELEKLYAELMNVCVKQKI